jgi:Ca-activated chloride channel family protein
MQAIWLPTIARGIVGSLIVLAAAGPRWPDPASRIATQGIAIELVLDVSGSMGEPDFPGPKHPSSRLDASRAVIHHFVRGGRLDNGTVLEGRPDDLIGLVTFASWPETRCPLTLSHETLLTLLDGEQPRRVPTESQTNIGDAVAWGLHGLESAPTRRKVVILLSDGEHNVPAPALTPGQAGRLAAALHTPVYAIDASGRPADESDKSAKAAQALENLARLSGARYFRAGTASALAEIYREIDQLERADIKSFVPRGYRDCYPWVGLAALLLCTLTRFVEQTLWRRIP